MASVATYLPHLITGSGLGYPVLISDGGHNRSIYEVEMEVKDDDEFGIGHLVMVATGLLTLDATAAKDFTAMAVVADTPRNKALMEAHGAIVAKGIAASFAAGDVIDVYFLFPGMIFSLIHDAVATIDIGDGVRCAAAGECAALAAIATDVDPATRIGRCYTRLVDTEGTNQYIVVAIGG